MPKLNNDLKGVIRKFGLSLFPGLATAMETKAFAIARPTSNVIEFSSFSRIASFSYAWQSML